MSGTLSLALLEVNNLAPSFIVADACSKAANVRILGIESTDGAAQCIKLVGPVADVQSAVETAIELAKRMGSSAFCSVMPAPLELTYKLADAKPALSPLLGSYDIRKPRENAMTTTNALGLLETQGLVAALHATDDMLKASNVTLAGKEKIGAAYVTIMIRGDVAAVQTAIEVGRQTVERLGGKLILADVIARPHADLAALLPT
ncbi:BMC domain-containing protein [Schlesneria paludicola]|uniref:BMC domain-containing protein n=1 Tax=Schlesneria paludicola TaxID=360056 RepID=UPI000299F5A9|nr:BMC domain-containing protein [Schlesneria paludicola]